MTSELATIGAQLQGARLARGASIDDVAHETRIPVSHLKSLEDGDYSEFAGMAYARSFLRLYGNYLDVDVTDGVATLEERRELSGEMEQFPFLETPEEVKLASEVAAPRSSNLPLAAIGLAVVAVLAVPIGLVVARKMFAETKGSPEEVGNVSTGGGSGRGEAASGDSGVSGTAGIDDEKTLQEDDLPEVVERVTADRLDSIRNPAPPEVRRAEVVEEVVPEVDEEDETLSEG